MGWQWAPVNDGESFHYELQWVDDAPAVNASSPYTAPPAAQAPTADSGGSGGGIFAGEAQRRKDEEQRFLDELWAANPSRGLNEQDPYADIASGMSSADYNNLRYGQGNTARSEFDRQWGLLRDAPGATAAQKIDALETQQPGVGRSVAVWAVQNGLISPADLADSGAWRVVEQSMQAGSDFGVLDDFMYSVGPLAMLSIPTMGLGLAAGLGTAGAGALTGGITGGLSSDPGDPMDVLKGVLGGGLMGGAAGMLPASWAPAAKSALVGAGSALTGGGSVEDMLRSAALSGGITGGAQAAAPYIDSAMPDFGSPAQAPRMPAAMPELDPTFGGALTQISPGRFITPDMPGMLSPTMMPPAVPEADPTFGGALSQMNTEGVYEAAPAQPAPAAPSPNAEKYAKIAKTVYQMLGQEDGAAPQGAPTQDEGETDEQYSQELAEYLSLDPKAMAEQGLEPGSPEYLEYIMAQADAVIDQLLGDIDPNAADLAAQLRGKTAEEMQDLQRALYVRGQTDMLMGAGTYTDPATGLSEEVIGAGMFNPATAAYQRGRARDVEGLAGAEDPRAQLDRLLGRDVDFFGMQGAADRHFEAAKRNEQSDEEMRRRRGMFSGY